MMWIVGISHALWLRHIDLLRKMPIEKGIIDIKLANSLLETECNAKHIMDGDEIKHETFNVVKINVRLFVKVFSNKASFILCNSVVRILFDAKHPFVAHYILPWSRGN